MLLDRAPAWDKYRSTSFFVGLFSSLLLSHVVLHIETPRPQFDSIFEAEYEEEIRHIPRTVHKKKKILPSPPPDVKINPTQINEIELVDDNDQVEYDTKIPTTDDEDTHILDSYIDQTPPKVEPVLPEPIEENNEPVVFAERMPIFGSCADMASTYDDLKLCSDSKLLAYMYKHIRYPAQARELGIEGTVVVEFIVEKDGSTTGVTILRSLESSCDREVLDIIRALPKWMTGKQNGRPVRVLFRVPVKFKLQ